MELSCIGCGLNCRYWCQGSSFKIRCDYKKLIVWPNSNYYFTYSIHNIFFEKCACYLYDGVIVVDFSHDNIMYFIDDNWLNKLSAINLKIILVVDSLMLPLANFWLQRTDIIWSIIVVNEDLAGFISNFKSSLAGRRSIKRKHPRLTEQEVVILKMIYSGGRARDMSRVLNCNAKKIYRMRNSLYKKMGGINKIKKIFFS